MPAVGVNVARKEGHDKVTGAARYVDDFSPPNLLHARTIR
jgi:CO/xanthine dehydrogenase Mo-binding subunit